MTISMLKRQVEKEFVDLYPFEDPLVCSKLEDSYGYALSNVSRVEELLVSGDRIMAVPISKRHDGRTLGSLQRMRFRRLPPSKRTSTCCCR